MPISRRAFLSALAPIAILGCAALPRAQADIILTSQPTVVNPANVGLGFYSSSHPRSTRNFKRGDDFILPTDSSLTRIRWWGQSEGRIFDDLRNFNQYTVEVFDTVDAPEGPLPGALLWSRVFAPAELSITPTGRIAPTSGASEHLYEATLPAAVQLAGNHAYILAISARSMNTLADAWQWQDGEFFGGHGDSYSHATRVWSSFEDTDSAFELIGAPVPAPAAGLTLLMLSAPFAARRVRAASPAQTPRA